MQLLKHFHKLSIHPKNANALKGLILQLAIQGKLTEGWRAQKGAIEPASELLKRIQKEKKQLVKEKKIKKEKPLSPITEDEIIYELPESWVWSRLGNYTYYGALAKFENKDAKKETWVLELEDIEKGSSKLLKKVRFTERDFKSTKSVFKSSDVIYGKLRPYLDKVIVADEDGVCTTEMIPIKSFSGCNPKYLRWFLKHPDFIEYANSSTHGMRMPRMGTDVAKKALISIPPLEEQKEIVRVVDVLFKEVEQLEKLTKQRIQLKRDYVTSALNQLATQNTQTAWQELTPHFSTFFDDVTNIKKLRETILQLAVQGKLTADWRARHPEFISGTHQARELLKSIQKEKAQLIKEKKIKKEKALPPITQEEIPYELPEGWVWCRFQEVFDIRDGTHDSPKNVSSKNSYPLVTSKDFKNGFIDLENAKRISEEDYHKIIQRSLVEEDDILFSMIGGNLGNQVMVKKNTAFAIKNVALFKYYKKSLSVPDFLKVFSEHTAYEIQYKATGGAQPFVSLTFLRQILFPLPSLEEQEAIVEKVNALMSLCDELEQEVQTGEQQLEDLMQSVLREVFDGKVEEKVALSMAAEANKVYESSNSSFDETFKSLNYDHEVAAVVLLTQEHFGFTYGKKYVHKMFSNINFLDELHIFNELQFHEHGWGMYSPILQKTLENEVFITYQYFGDNKRTLHVKPKEISQIKKWIKANENRQFVNQVNQMLTIYEQPLIDKNMNRIELLNTVLECMVVLKTDTLKDIRAKMKNWKMFEGNYNTKAEKFSENETLHMIHFIKGLKSYTDNNVNK